MATPSPTPPGTLAVAYSSAANFGVSGAAPAALAFTAPTETATLTATQANYTGSFGASSNCASVTVAPATSATGVFTATAVAPVATGCTITVTGATGTTAVAIASTVPTPGGTVLRWYTPNYLTQSPPLAIAAGPINLVGLGATFASVLAISEQNYIGGFTAANIVASAGCTGFATKTADATVPTGLPTAAPGTSLVYYTITGVAAVNTTGGCTITATDSQTTPSAGSIGVSITTVTGTFQ
ncbi:MAG: hypothetical protein ABSH03_01290 [Candidatus Lustribacter sp.]